MPGEIVDAVVPKSRGVGIMVNGLLGVLVTAIITHPYVEAELDKSEGERAFGVGEAYPNLGVHEKTMVEVYYGLAGG